MRTDCVTGCGHEADGYYLCAACIGSLLRGLRDVPDLVDELETAMAKLARMGERVRTARAVVDPALPLNSGAADALRDLHGVLAAWASELGSAPESPSSPEAAARHLAGHASTLRTHPRADELHDELTDAVSRGWRAVDRPRPWRYAGPCDECGDDLHAPPNAATVVCRECGAGFDAESRREFLLEAVADRLASASEIARAVPNLLGRSVTPAMIRGYVHRGRLVAHGRDRAGKSRFRVGDVVDVVLSG